MSDPRNHAGTAGVPTFPADGVAVTKNDATMFEPSVLFITGAGDVKVTTEAGNTRTFTVPANYTLGCRVTRVYSTDTTATGFIRYW